MRARRFQLSVVSIFLIGSLVSTGAGIVAVQRERKIFEMEVSAAADNRVAALRREFQAETARLRIVSSTLAGTSFFDEAKMRNLLSGIAAAADSATRYCWVTMTEKAAGRRVVCGYPGGNEGESGFEAVIRGRAAEILTMKPDARGITIGRRIESEALGFPVIMSIPGRLANGTEGLAMAVFSVSTLVERGFKGLRPFGINAAVYDLDAPAARSLLSFHKSRRSQATVIPSPWEAPGPQIHGSSDTIEIGNRRIEIRCEPIQEILGQWPSWPILGFTAAGWVISLLSAVLIQRGEDQRSKIETVVANRTRELAVARDEAMAAAQWKTQLVANVSHELRTPLHGMMSVNELLLLSGLRPDQMELQETMQHCGRALLALVEDLLDTAKIEAGTIAVVDEPFSLRRTVMDCATIARIEASTKQLTWTLDIPNELPDWIKGDQNRLRQVLLNLISNAIKFTDKGSIGLRLEVRANPSPVFVFSVQDTGAGIPVEAQGRVFRRFSQAETDPKRRRSGVGLGLSISRHLVERMGGEMNFRSEPGVGSEFWFTLPVRPAPLAKPLAAEDRPTPAPSLEGLRVLVAEDNAINQRLAARILEKAGCKVGLAGNGVEAVRLARSDQFDVILMDMQMPEMDGMDATKEIRSLSGPSANLPIFAFSANTNEDDVRCALAAGMNGHLSKPIEMDRLLAVLSSCLVAPRS